MLTTKLFLVTDDSGAVRKIARRILQGLNFEVDEAEDGLVALEKCGTRMPEAILLDWNMPRMNGVQFLVALRRMEGGNAPKVILCTTESDVGHIREALDAGANEYLIKPFDSAGLLAKLNTLALT